MPLGMNSGARGMDRLRAMVAGGLCLLALVPAGTVALREWHASRLVEAMAGPPDLRAEVIERYADSDPDSLTDRANAALGQSALIEASQTESPALRQVYLGFAGTHARYLARTRPDWAPSLLLSAQMELATHAQATPQALRAYAASYRAAPFLMTMARWRIAFGGEYWQGLDPATRKAMIAEAVWLTRFDGGSRPEVLGLLGDTPAGMAYAMAYSLRN